MATPEALRSAYARHAQSIAGYVRFELVTRELLMILGDPPARVLDVGGGHGLQAVLLAQAGHEVLVLDPDPVMLKQVDKLAASAGSGVRERISTVQGYGEDAHSLAGGEYDLVCCHSVLMYVDTPGPLVRQLVSLTRSGGYVSILAMNKRALAMRYGLREQWKDALATLKSDAVACGEELSVRADDPAEIEALLQEQGATSCGWSGIRIFSDHLADRPARSFDDDLADLFELEWTARRRDPYRLVARLFHLVAECPSDAGIWDRHR